MIFRGANDGEVRRSTAKTNHHRRIVGTVECPQGDTLQLGVPGKIAVREAWQIPSIRCRTDRRVPRTEYNGRGWQEVEGAKGNGTLPTRPNLASGLLRSRQSGAGEHRNFQPA